jgi:hypothetical protein
MNGHPDNARSKPISILACLIALASTIPVSVSKGHFIAKINESSMRLAVYISPKPPFKSFRDES